MNVREMILTPILNKKQFFYLPPYLSQLFIQETVKN